MGLEARLMKDRENAYRISWRRNGGAMGNICEVRHG